MSSFVIDKKNYIRVAGLIAGIAEEANRYGCMDRFWIYDPKSNRNMIAEDYLARFTQCYEMNVDSVNEEWKVKPGDKCFQFYDPCEYLDEFKKYQKIGKRTAMNRYCKPDEMMNIIHAVREFGSSVRYQIDNDTSARIVNSWFNTVTVKLLGLLPSGHEDTEFWGEFDLEAV